MLSAASGRSYANATKKSATNSPVAAQAAGNPSHGKSDSITPVNGKSAIPPAVPTLGTPTIVNGNNAGLGPSGHSEHSRKPSVTISAQGASGHMPNGGPAVGKPAVTQGLRFGSASPAIVHSTPQLARSSDSLAVAAQSNPRITSPATSPSPIPQPPASGGRPPSGLQSQGNNLNFGSLGVDDPSVSFGTFYPFTQHISDPQKQRQLRPGMPPGSLTPGMQAQHLRRESSQSSHGDMGNVNMNANNGRGGYPHQGGRGRGFNSQYPQQIPYSPNTAFRSVPNQPRGGPNMGQQFQPQGRQLGNYPHSPHQAARSPALANATPIHPQTGQMPMPSPQMQHSPYGAYPQQMGPPQVKPPSSSSSLSKDRTQKEKQQNVPPSNFFNHYPPPNLAPDSGQFEQFLMTRNQNQFAMPHGYDLYSPFYSPYMPPAMGYMPPVSPRPPYNVPSNSQAQYIPGQYAGPQPAPPMSRTPSAVSDRPNPGAAQPQTPMTPAPNHPVIANRRANSPAPKSTTTFQIPARKGVGVVIKDPNSGAVKTFDKQQPASPAPPSKSPANASSTPTPPPRTPNNTEAHHRSDSKTVKTDEEKKNEMKDAIAKKIEADRQEAIREKEEAEAKAVKEKEEAEAKRLEAQKTEDAEADEEAQQVKEAAEAKEAKEAAEAKEAKEAAEKEAKAKTEAEAEASAEAERTNKAAADASVTQEDDEAAKARKQREEDEYFARLEEEMEREEREREERYQEKKAVEKEEQARKAAEAAVREDEELKQAEREAEAREEARLRKLEEDDDTGKDQRGDLFAELKKPAASPQTAPSPAAETPAESGTATPVSDASSMAPPPPRVSNVAKKVPAALKIETTKPVEAPQPSAALQSLRSARFLTAINDVTYPSTIASPNPALNTAAPMGKFRYDKNFLMQFQTVFVEKPSETWTDKVKETVGDTSETPASARGSARTGGMMTSRQPSNRASVVPGGSFSGGAFAGFTNTGRTLPPGSTSESRYQASTQGAPRPTGQNAVRYNPNAGPAFPISLAQPISRTASSTSLGHPHSPRSTPSQRGRGSNRGKPQREIDQDAKKMPLTADKDLKPIQVSATGWKPRSVGANASMAGPLPGGDGYLAPDVVQRKVKAALNKMTPNNFDKLAGQILDIVAQSKKETDGRTLRQVIQLTFEKATDEAHWAQMYAEFCSRMLQYMSPEIRDETLPVDKNGKVNAGGTLFRKYLLNRCQQDFEAGWKDKLPDKPEGEMSEAAMLSDEYYIAAAAKRRGLGLVRFIGELFKLGMLTSRIMHMCVKRLVDWEGLPDEAEVESLTSLLRTIGETLDAEEKMRPTMDAYFDRISNMLNTKDLPSRLRFMLMVSFSVDFFLLHFC